MIPFTITDIETGEAHDGRAATLDQIATAEERDAGMYVVTVDTGISTVTLGGTATPPNLLGRWVWLRLHGRRHRGFVMSVGDVTRVVDVQRAPEDDPEVDRIAAEVIAERGEALRRLREAGSARQAAGIEPEAKPCGK